MAKKPQPPRPPLVHLPTQLPPRPPIRAMERGMPTPRPIPGEEFLPPPPPTWVEPEVQAIPAALMPEGPVRRVLGGKYQVGNLQAVNGGSPGYPNMLMGGTPIQLLSLSDYYPEGEVGPISVAHHNTFYHDKDGNPSDNNPNTHFLRAQWGVGEARMEADLDLSHGSVFTVFGRGLDLFLYTAYQSLSQYLGGVASQHLEGQAIAAPLVRPSGQFGPTKTLMVEGTIAFGNVLTNALVVPAFAKSFYVLSAGSYDLQFEFDSANNGNGIIVPYTGLSGPRTPSWYAPVPVPPVAHRPGYTGAASGQPLTPGRRFNIRNMAASGTIATKTIFIVFNLDL